MLLSITEIQRQANRLEPFERKLFISKYNLRIAQELKMNNRVLVTGSTGFIGRHLVKNLKELGKDVIEVSLQKGIDITNLEQLRDIEGFDLAYHLAAISSVAYSFEHEKEVYNVNVSGTLNVLELCRINNAKIVFASTYLYGKPKYLPVDEKHTLSPSNPYAMSKYYAEKLCKVYSDKHNIPAVILRTFNVYGEGQRNEFLIPTILKQLQNKKVVLKDPEPKRDFIYISDVVDAYLRAGRLERDFEVFNIGYGRSYSVREIVDKILALYSRDVKVEYTFQRRIGEIMDMYADTSKAKRLLGWSAKVSIDEGLRRVVMHELNH